MALLWCGALILLSVPTSAAAENESWTAPHLVGRGSANGTYSAPTLTTGPGNALVLAWIQPFETVVGRIRVMKSQFTPGGGWQSPSEVGPAGSTREPSASLDASGRVMIGYIGPQLNATVSVSPEAGAMTGETSHLDPDDAQIWQVWTASDDQGRGVAAWHRIRYPPVHAFVDSEIWVSAYRPSSGWDTPVKLAGADDVDARFAVLAMDDGGNATLAWRQWVYDGVYGGSPTAVVAVRYDPKVGWSAPVEVATHVGGIDRAYMGMDSRGGAVLVWRQSTESGHAIMGRRFIPGAGWGPSEVVSEGAPVGGVSVSVAVNPSGHAIALWDQGKELWSSQRTPETGWTAAERVVELGGPPGRFDIAMDPKGFGVATWSNGTLKESTVAVARFVPGGGWEDPSMIARIQGPAYVLGPDVVIAEQGEAFIAWSRLFDDDHGVWSSRFPAVSAGTPMPLLLVVGAGAAGVALAAATYTVLRRRKKP